MHVLYYPLISHALTPFPHCLPYISLRAFQESCGYCRRREPIGDREPMGAYRTAQTLLRAPRAQQGSRCVCVCMWGGEEIYICILCCISFSSLFSDKVVLTHIELQNYLEIKIAFVSRCRSLSKKPFILHLSI